MERVLILGATGTLAGLTARRLLEQRGVRVRLASSRSAGVELLRKTCPAAEVVKADWYRLGCLIDALKGVDRVLVVSPDFVTDERLATGNLAAAVRRAGGVAQILRLIAIPPGVSEATLEPEFLATRAGANLHVVAKSLLDLSALPVTYLNVPCWIMMNYAWFFGDELRQRRRLAMPAGTDAPRLWIAEQDLADILATLLVEPAHLHVGREYTVTGEQRFRFADVARLTGELLGQPVGYSGDEAPLRRVAGPRFDDLMTYFRHEVRDYATVTISPTGPELLRRAQLTLRDYLQQCLPALLSHGGD